MAGPTFSASATEQPYFLPSIEEEGAKKNAFAIGAFPGPNFAFHYFFTQRKDLKPSQLVCSTSSALFKCFGALAERFRSAPSERHFYSPFHIAEDRRSSVVQKVPRSRLPSTSPLARNFCIALYSSRYSCDWPLLIATASASSSLCLFQRPFPALGSLAPTVFHPLRRRGLLPSRRHSHVQLHGCDVHQRLQC